MPYWKQLLACDETEKRLTFLLNYCKDMHVPICKPKSPTEFSEKIKEISDELETASHLIFGKIEADADKSEKFVQK